MRRPGNHAEPVASIQGTTPKPNDTGTSHEVQGEIVATGIVVQGLGDSRERPTERYLVLAEENQEQSTQTGLDEDSVKAGRGNDLASACLIRERLSDSIASERTRRAMGRPAGLALAYRPVVPDQPRNRSSLPRLIIMLRRGPANASLTSPTGEH